MKIIALVPIKMNNERLPGKNTRCFSDGTPLIKCVLTTLSDVPELDAVYVYCSNPEIQKFFPNSRIEYLRRSETLDRSSTKINEILSAFANDVPADIYVLTHATAPFIQSERFSEGIGAVKSRKYDSAVAVNELKEFLWKDGKPFNYDPTAVPRTQDIPSIYKETSGLYVYSSNLILQKNRRIGYNPYFVKVSEVEAVDIDNPIDFEIANAIYMNIIKRRCNDVKHQGDGLYFA